VIEKNGFFGPEQQDARKAVLFRASVIADLMKMNARFAARSER
jgi:hypothetical protein